MVNFSQKYRCSREFTARFLSEMLIFARGLLALFEKPSNSSHISGLQGCELFRCKVQVSGRCRGDNAIDN